MPFDDDTPRWPATDAVILLDRAIGKIAKADRWCQERVLDDQGRRCIAGALLWAANSRDALDLRTGLVADVWIALTKEAMVHGLADPAMFNDVHTHQDVLALMHSARKRLLAERG